MVAVLALLSLPGVPVAAAAEPSFVMPVPLLNVPPSVPVPTNWAGYVISADPGEVTAVKGQWTVPTITCTDQKGITSAWVGMDGYGTTTMEKVGTFHYCVHGYPVYGSFYQMFPAPATFPRLIVQPGDVMEGEVRWVSGNTFRVSIRNITSGRSYTMNTTQPNAARQSAAWIVEDVTYDGTLRSLTTMSRVGFSQVSATVGGSVGGIRSLRWDHTMLTLYNPLGERITAPTVLKHDVRNFVVGRVTEESTTRGI